jgi:hypothetical protein
MGELSSKLFTEGDADAVKKLDNCATGRPTEVQSHFTQGMKGEAIKKLQLALKNERHGPWSAGIAGRHAGLLHQQRV